MITATTKETFERDDCENKFEVHLNENKTQKGRLEAREESLIFRQVRQELKRVCGVFAPTRGDCTREQQDGKSD